MPENDGPITFGKKELDPAEAEAYRRRIEDARRGGVGALKTPEPVGVLPRPQVPLRQGEAPAQPSGLTAEGGVQPRPPGSPLLSQETAQQLQQMADAQAKEQAKVEEKKEAEETKQSNEDIFEMFDFQQRSEAERVLNNKKRRKDIEDRCAPMNIDDLVLRDEVQQLVPIVPGKFEVLFRSITPDENLFIKRFVTKADSGQNEQYILEKFGICQLVCSVVAINGRPLPEHRDVAGDIVEKNFEAKLKMMLKKSGYVIGDLGINYTWFDIRVRKLLNPDILGNG